MSGFWHRPREQRWRGWIFRIHLWSGLTIGLWSKGLWFLLGLAPGTLITTGFLMWWNRVAGKRYRAWRQSSLDTPANAGQGLPPTATDEAQA